jgi:hypothetical protein
VAAATWLLDALLGQTQATLSEIKVEEWKFVENSGPRGVKTSLMDPEERMGYNLLLFQNELSKDWAQEAFKKAGVKSGDSYVRPHTEAARVRPQGLLHNGGGQILLAYHICQ